MFKKGCAQIEKLAVAYVSSPAPEPEPAAAE
jgi:hypothetical protein